MAVTAEAWQRTTVASHSASTAVPYIVCNKTHDATTDVGKIGMLIWF